MGCNYYAIPKADDSLKKEIIEAVNSNDFTLVKKLIPDQIHIGKSSMGWQFLFNHNDWQYFEKSKESLEQFLFSCDIYDEYDKPITNEDFWKMVEVKSLAKSNLIWISEEVGTIEFGLNFSKHTDFC